MVFHHQRVEQHPEGRVKKSTAAVDRLLHHAHVVVTEGTSLRLAEATGGRGVVPLT